MTNSEFLVSLKVVDMSVGPAVKFAEIVVKFAGSQADLTKNFALNGGNSSGDSVHGLIGLTAKVVGSSHVAFICLLLNKESSEQLLGNCDLLGVSLVGVRIELDALSSGSWPIRVVDSVSMSNFSLNCAPGVNSSIEVVPETGASNIGGFESSVDNETARVVE